MPPPQEVQDWLDEHDNPSVMDTSQVRTEVVAGQQTASKIMEQAARLGRKIRAAQNAAPDEQRHRFNRAIQGLERARQDVEEAFRVLGRAQEGMTQYDEATADIRDELTGGN